MVRRFIQQHEMGMARTHEAEKKTRLLPQKGPTLWYLLLIARNRSVPIGPQTGLLGHWKERVEMVVGGDVGPEFFRLMLGKVADFEFP